MALAARARNRALLGGIIVVARLDRPVLFELDHSRHFVPHVPPVLSGRGPPVSGTEGGSWPI
jgi:hypothetical protein